MPDFIVELTHTTGPRQAMVKSVTVPDVKDQQMATMAGIQELLKWGAQEGWLSGDPWEYWQEARSGSMMPYEVLTELESRFQLTFNTRVVPPTSAVPPVKSLPGRNGTADTSLPSNLQQTLAQTLTSLIERQKALAEDVEWMQLFLTGFLHKPVKRRRRKNERTKRDRPTSSPLDQA